jgi:class 3 adenylate cyclase
VPQPATADGGRQWPGAARPLGLRVSSPNADPADRSTLVGSTGWTGLLDVGVAIRAGVHRGEVELRGEDVSGIGVHIAARVAALAGSGELLASRTVKDLVAGSGYAFASRGVHSLKGVPEEWELLAVT